MSKLYIVMPVVNCLELTRPAFQSIKSNVPFTFVLIDQDSNDGTEVWGPSMAENPTIEGPVDPNLKKFVYIRYSPKITLSTAWNNGIKLAMEDPECKYIAILNNDILLHPKTLNHLMAFMDETKYMMVTGDNIKDRMSSDVMMQMELPVAFTDFDTQPITDWRAEGPDFSCFLITPETVKTIGYFDDNFKGAYCEDQDYHARVDRARRWGVQYSDPDPKYMHTKRLSTAPYYHYASQTIARNVNARHDVAVMHGHNMDLYVKKWGGEHPFVMDGGGNMTPYGDATKNWRDQ